MPAARSRLAAAMLLKDGRQEQHPDNTVPTPQGASSTTTPGRTAPGEIHASPGNIHAAADDTQLKRIPGEWNGIDYYVMFGDDEARSWEDARSYGYVSAGGGSRWSTPLQRLQPGARVFVHHPHDGYVGIGRVVEGPVPIGDFTVMDGGQPRSLLDIPLRNNNIKKDATDPERAEFLVRVEWEWAVPAGQGIWAKHFFSRRVTVAKLRDPVTSRKLCAHAGEPYTEG